MEERFDRLEKNMNDLIEIVVSIKDNMTIKQELAEVEERLTARMDTLATKEELKEMKEMEERIHGRVDGLQRADDAAFERDSALEGRILKIETELHA
jgi:prefoldin subunit 5